MNTFLTKSDKNISIIALVSTTDHMILACIYSYFLLIPILYCLHTHLITSKALGFFSKKVVRNFIPEESVPFVILSALDYCSFSLTLITGQSGTKGP